MSSPPASDPSEMPDERGGLATVNVNASVDTPDDLDSVVAHPGGEKGCDVDNVGEALNGHNDIAEGTKEAVIFVADSDTEDTQEAAILADDSDMEDTREAVSSVDESDAEDIREVVNVVQAQESFQPGATPMNNGKRYLGRVILFSICLVTALTRVCVAHNLVGVIEVTDLVTHHVVNVQFHDMSMRRAYHFADHFRYDMASLGQRGAIYACQPDTSHPAHVVYKPYSSWTCRSDWTYELRSGTSVVGVAAGGSPTAESLRKDVDIESLGNVVIATSDGDLIFLSGGGVERACVSLPGTFITMVAGPEWVFLVTRDGSTTTDGSQNLMGRLIKFDDFCILQKDNLPVPKHHTLKWVGITEEGVSF